MNPRLVTATSSAPAAPPGTIPTPVTGTAISYRLRRPPAPDVATLRRDLALRRLVPDAGQVAIRFGAVGPDGLAGVVVLGVEAPGARLHARGHRGGGRLSSLPGEPGVFGVGDLLLEHELLDRLEAVLGDAIDVLEAGEFPGELGVDLLVVEALELLVDGFEAFQQRVDMGLGPLGIGDVSGVDVLLEDGLELALGLRAHELLEDALQDLEVLVGLDVDGDHVGRQFGHCSVLWGSIPRGVSPGS